MRGATYVYEPKRRLIQTFQSTRPMRGATSNAVKRRQYDLFQSTRPMRGATVECCMHRAVHIFYFNPRAPCGARRRADRQRRPACGFQSTRPMRGATAKVYKITLHTFATKGNSWTISRKTLPFKAFCRLQIGKNFSICGANRCGNFCELLLRTIRSSVLPEGRSACSQNAQFYSHTFSRDNRNADCLFPDP